MGQVFINGQWVDDGKDTYFDAATNLRIGSQGTGSEATGYKTPPGLPTEPSKVYNIPPAAPTDQSASPGVSAVSEARYQASRREALKLQDIRARNALSDCPPGSPTSYLGAGGKVMGSIQTDELGIRLPTPRGAVGLRGYPTTDEINAGIARDAAQAREDQFTGDINSVMGRYPAAPKFQAPTTDQLIAPLVARRNTEQAAVNSLNQRLQSESDQPVPLGRGRYGPSPASGTRRELAIRSQNLGELDRAQQAAIVSGARLADQASKQSEIAARDTASGQIKDFLNNIDGSRYPIGSPERERFIARIFMNRDDWLHAAHPKVNPELSKYVQDHMEVHRDVGATMQALKSQYGEGAYGPPTVTDRGGGKITTRYSPAKAESDKIPANAAIRHAKIIGDIAYHQKAKAAEPNTPYADEARLQGAIADKQELEQQFPKLGVGSMVVQIPQAAKDALRDDPSRALEFEKKFGKGTAAIILR